MIDSHSDPLDLTGAEDGVSIAKPGKGNDIGKDGMNHSLDFSLANRSDQSQSDERSRLDGSIDRMNPDQSHGDSDDGAGKSDDKQMKPLQEGFTPGPHDVSLAS